MHQAFRSLIRRLPRVSPGIADESRLVLYGDSNPPLHESAVAAPESKMCNRFRPQSSLSEILVMLIQLETKSKHRIGCLFLFLFFRFNNTCCTVWCSLRVFCDTGHRALFGLLLHAWRDGKPTGNEPCRSNPIAVAVPRINSLFALHKGNEITSATTTKTVVHTACHIRFQARPGIVME